MNQTSPYIQLTQRKRAWEPQAVTRGHVKDEVYPTIYRGLALRSLELPVAGFLNDAMRRDLPTAYSGVREALESNVRDEERHDRAFELVVKAHGTDTKAEKEGQNILKAWLELDEHPVLKAAILERSVFFVLLPIYRFLGDLGLRTTAADISADEATHVAVHSMVAKELGLRPSQALNRLRRATVAWVVDPLGSSENKYEDKDFWLAQSDSLFSRGQAPGLAETRRSRMPAFFEGANTDLPQYG